MIAVLCGGVGGSRFLRALSMIVNPARITAIVNTADDDIFHGLYVSPDTDIITYTLAGEVDDERGWGLRGDTFRWLESLRRFGHETWFNIGDRDLATHLHRTRQLTEGRPLSVVAAELAEAFGVRVRVLPMSDAPVRTIVETAEGERAFQQFLVRDRARPRVTAVRYDGAATAVPAPGVFEAIADAEGIFIAPSNPVGSIGPILAVSGIAGALADARVRRIAVSPIVAGRSLQPPASEMMAGTGLPVDVTGVARAYAGMVDALVIDPQDAALATRVAEWGIEPVIAPVIMRDEEASRALARVALACAGIRA